MVGGHREPGNVCIYRHGGIKGISLAAQDRAVAGGRKAPVSPCKPLCEIFLRKPSGVPTFARESERGAFVGEVKKWLGTALWR